MTVKQVQYEDKKIPQNHKIGNILKVCKFSMETGYALIGRPKKKYDIFMHPVESSILGHPPPFSIVYRRPREL